jgi:ankyrin repeat protein
MPNTPVRTSLASSIARAIIKISKAEGGTPDWERIKRILNRFPAKHQADVVKETLKEADEALAAKLINLLPEEQRALITHPSLTQEQQDKLNEELLKSVNKNDLAQAKTLLEEGANPNAKDIFGISPLHWATIDRNIEIILLLIDKGADINAKDNDGRPPISYSDDNETIKALLKAGAEPSLLYPEVINNDSITILFKETIDQNDHQSVTNLYKHFRSFAREASLYASLKNNSDMVNLLNTIIRQNPPSKIAHYELNKLFHDNANKDEIKLNEWLESNNYYPDLAGLTIDGNKFNKNLKILDFSGLNLANSKLHNLSSEQILFTNADLTNANIRLESYTNNIDFAKANLTRSYISGMRMNQANFAETTIQSSMIINSQTNNSSLSEQQKLQTIDLVIAPEKSFKQKHLVHNYTALLEKAGICNGLCVELARYVLMSQEKGEGYGDYLQKLTRKLKNPSINFAYRVQSYQDNLQPNENNITIKTEKIRNHQFLQSIPSEIEHSDILGCAVSADNRQNLLANHIFTVLKLRDETKNIIGYKIFDPNYGDIICKNEAELNQQVNLLFQHYQKEVTNRESTFSIVALDDLVKKYGLIHPKDVDFNEQEKTTNKEKKYAKMLDQQKLYLIIQRKELTPTDIDKAKTQLDRMSTEEINQPIILRDEYKTSLLMMAIKANNIAIVDLLIKKNADIITPINNITPLLQASILQHTEIKEALISAGAEQSINDSKSISKEQQEKLDKALLSKSSEKEKEKIIKLLEGGANPNAKDTTGFSALHWATMNGNIEIILLLIDKGADINAKDNDGRSPIHYSADNEKINILLKAGGEPADLNPVFLNNDNIVSLLDESIKNNHQEILNTLIQVINDEKLRQEFNIDITNNEISRYISNNPTPAKRSNSLNKLSALNNPYSSEYILDPLQTKTPDAPQKKSNSIHRLITPTNK